MTDRIIQELKVIILSEIKKNFTTSFIVYLNFCTYTVCKIVRLKFY